MIPQSPTIFLYGPPASGKSSYGKRTAEALGLDFIDIDQVILRQTGKTIPQIFEDDGEQAFRDAETAALASICEKRPAAVVALGGGSLLRSQNRALVEQTGTLVCLLCPHDLLLERAAGAPGTRPLAASPERTAELLKERQPHYESFPLTICITPENQDTIPDEILLSLGLFHVKGMGAAYDVTVLPGAIGYLPQTLLALDQPPRHLLIVGDSNTLPLYGETVLQACARAEIPCQTFQIPAGEATKTFHTVTTIWDAMLRANLERTDLVIALGGGIVGDLTGFAAATWLRGIRWLNIPTTLLAMVDAGIGGKTGADLPQGKNLIGAFHSPAAVLSDTETLLTLPRRELLCGAAETYKHAVIGDPGLIPLLLDLPGRESDVDLLTRMTRRSLFVKIKTILQDPYEKTGIRAALNLGHTLGHAVETASDFTIQHGEAVAIGTVAAARLAANLGIAPPELPQTIATHLAALGLPTAIPENLDRKIIRDALTRDKKKAAGSVRFVLPESIGKVRTGCTVPPELLDALLGS